MSEPKCPHCGNDPLTTVEFCQRCGKEMGESGQDGNGWNCTCPRCGNNTWTIVCAICGDPVDERDGHGGVT